MRERAITGAGIPSFSHFSLNSLRPEVCSDWVHLGHMTTLRPRNGQL